MIATQDSELAQLKKEMGTKHKIISSLSTKNKAYADSVSRLKNTDESLLQTQNELELLKSTLSNTKNQLIALLSDNEILETQLEEQNKLQDSLLNLTDWKFKKIAFYKKKSISISPNLRFLIKTNPTPFTEFKLEFLKRKLS